MKASEIREMEAGQIEGKIGELKRELFNLRFQKDVGQLENTTAISDTKKDIARLYTVLREFKR